MCIRDRKKTLRDYLPILLMLLCTAGFGILLLTGVLDLNTIPQLVDHRPGLAVAVILALFAVKGISGVVVYLSLIHIWVGSSRLTLMWPQSSQVQAGIWWPHHSWREMHQSWTFSIQLV